VGIESLITTAGVLIVVVVCGVVFLFVARALLRLAMKAAMVMAIVFALLLGAGIGWWRGWFSSSPAKPPVETNQRINANRRAPR
jgi:hypothetical protein